MRFSVYQESRKGGRRINQDRMGYCFTRDALLMVLADGLGGHALGEVAAQQALQTLARQFQTQARPAIRNPADFLQDTIMLAHREIHRYAEANRLADIPRTTVVCCLIQHGQIHWAHAGDSRFYLMRKGALLTRTRDHSKIENLLQQERVLPMDVANHPERNKLYNCLGSPNLPLIDIGGPVRLNPGDVALLCSDGLWGSLEEDIIVDKVTHLSVVHAIPDLIERALANAGEGADNTTAIAMMWEADANVPNDDAVLTDTLPLNAFTTSILERTGSETDLLSEEEIERSIAEIRAAIDKTSNLMR
ncbi:PPM family protein phosphatase [Cupriavidus metallidurans]|jgi:PPM family protein phosphatase|uniref:Serine/threonine protein phosphatase n=2 Tax=Cupriavidus metallidurans TaxID=119219 RepID=Q1LQ37_CUPMC|nr:MULTISPECIES: PP2C family serine/threonine-protein phosphatase [Cupriavidus]PCH57435.1 MAG: serine/threonine-protein phosphatase [Burkholderiaceae bacterium]HBO79293.1 serine/threonine-protein phosphatase [Cupriavidus sp.]ABF07739.1 Serine/threonine protein phosphatase [Cupriavidus metallidurans CH34]AVA33037.1 serine/threonine-protein phosphatase [Cupriavidus metallidurans]KWR79736.1 serine/threonine protein phosphatase [Cupriavidus sp. SHE]